MRPEITTIVLGVALADSGTAILVRVVPSLGFPVLAGWLVRLFYQE